MANTVAFRSISFLRKRITYQVLNGDGSFSTKRLLHCCAILGCNKSSVSVADAKLHNLETRKIEPKTSEKSEKISKAMRSYLQRLQEYDSMLNEQVAEYEIGKRHLANIMGEDPESFTQADIDKAISYLLPSGLYDRKARPVMKHPLEILPARETPQFGMDGRPFHFLYYTGRPHFFELMHNISCKLEDLKSGMENFFRKGVHENIDDKKLVLRDTEWISKDDIEKRMVEKISDHHYRQFTVLFDRLVNHPLSFKEEAFIMEYRKKLPLQSAVQSVKTPSTDADGREFIVETGKRKTSFAHVKLWGKGTGQISINNRDLFYFEQPIHRQQVLFPLQFVNKLGDVDFVATVDNGGPTGQSGAVRLALSKALASFVGCDMAEKMRLAGLLTSDPRRRERKKPGQEGARKKFTWKKR